MRHPAAAVRSFLLLLLLLTGCGPDAAALDATVVAGALQPVAATVGAQPAATAAPTLTAWPTLVAEPSPTAHPSLTPNPTLTPWPTLTPLPTLTDFPTWTPTPTLTPTPVPPTRVPWTPTPAGPVFGAGTVREAQDLARELLLSVEGRCTRVNYWHGGCVERDYLIDCHWWLAAHDELRSLAGVPNPLPPVDTAGLYALFQENTLQVAAAMEPWRAGCQEAQAQGVGQINTLEHGGDRMLRVQTIQDSRSQLAGVLSSLENLGYGGQ